ncbi:putative ABC transport system permease protein [Neomicrococcus aestuarii]|uniref:Putative ABC transport system permease protein n=1 Tax=Neomicrococcus aestuarii TaxID=556325 RepID=A0A7W8WYK6_9MICC|nr:ABC transporter permease [Neomicrococcus aestuarii]MBB5511340.1 putative ABC transport system permease protein [Neomicrococcus aestuarii]
MQTIALSTLRAYWRRYVAVALAIMVGVAFLAATLMVQSITRASLGASLGESYRGSALVLERDAAAYQDGSAADMSEPPILNDSHLQFLEGTSLISAAQPVGLTGTTLLVERSGENGDAKPVAESAMLTIAPTAAGIGALSVLEGKAPVGANQAAIPRSQAERLELGVGDTINVGAQAVTISGLSADSNNPTNTFGVQVWADLPLVRSIMKNDLRYDAIALKLAPGVSIAQAESELSQAATSQGLTDLTFKTPDEVVNDQVASFTGESDVLTTVLLIFAGVALFVMTLVVSNTFAVIVAQRTRELGLLRTLGADQRQIRRMVRVEAALLGIVASVLGVVLGVAVMAGLVAWAKTLPGAIFTTFSLTPTALLVPLVVGTLLTLIAASAPARRATQVTPLEALRPQDVSTTDQDFGHASTLGMSKGLFIWWLLVFLAGTGALVTFSVFSPNLIIAFFAGVVSLTGVVVLAPTYIPRTVAALGKLTGTRTAPAKLAALNAVRQPRRTSATGTALVIGVSLVTMFLTGGTVAKATLDGAVATQYPVDFTVSSGGSFDSQATSTPLTAADADRLKTISGIEAAALMQPVGVTDESGEVLAASAADLRAVLNDPAMVPPEGSIIAGKEAIPADSVQVELTSGKTITVPVVHAGADYFQPIVTLETAQSWGAVSPATSSGASADEDAMLPTLYARGSSDLDSTTLNQIRDDISSTLGVAPMNIGGAAMMRASVGGFIDILLMIVSGLLAVSILIAVIGVSNTLSLSIIERSQENSLLRALGLTTSQLRAMISREALLVSLTAAILGTVLGVGYGLAGAQAAMGNFAPLVLDLPWITLGVVLVCAILAGLIAAIVPIRRAVHLSPVAGMREAVA